MKMYDLSLILIVGIVVSCAIGGLISVYFLGPNNPVELEAEKIIKDETGIDINLDAKKPVI